VNSIRVIYGNSDQSTTKQHGGKGTKEYIFDLDTDESIIRIEGRCADLIDCIMFITNKNRQSPMYGGTGGNPFCLESQGKFLKYLEGYATRDLLCAICPHWWEIMPIQCTLANSNFKMDLKKIAASQVAAGGNIVLTNESSINQTCSSTYSTQVEESDSVSLMKGLKEGLKVTMKADFVPKIFSMEAEGSMEWNVEHTSTFTYTKTTTKSEFVQAEVPPRSQIQVDFVIKMIETNIPFTCDIVTLWSNNTSTTEKIEGVYKGVKSSVIEARYHKEIPLA